MNFLRSFTFVVILAAAIAAAARSERTLDIYFIDVEGGQATLIVTPRHQSLLIDTGFPDFNGRDADRIVAAAHTAAISQIDYLIITHYHRDHVGGVPQLADRMKVATFVDHGTNQEDTDALRPFYLAYEQITKNATRVVVKPGDTLPLDGVGVQVLSAAGELITSPLSSSGQKNSACPSEPAAPDDASENARSVGILVKFGKFRFLDLGDLTKRKEIDLVCPVNLIGPVDLYLTTHHGLAQSNAAAMLQAIQPRVAIMNNGAHKGGSPAAWQIVRDSPRLQDLWQLHYAMDSDRAHNAPDERIANLKEQCEGKYLKVSAHSDGTFRVLNSRNASSRIYSRQ